MKIKWSEKKYETVFLIIILILSFTVRIYRLKDRIYWTGDSARDYLVAYHLAKFDGKINSGPTASGIGFYYPPFYYYLLSKIVVFNDSRLFLIGLIVFLFSLSVVAIYFTGKTIGGKLAGTLSAVIFATSGITATLSTQFHGAIVGTLIFIFFLWIYFQALEKKRFSLAAISFLLLLAASVMSYSVFIFIPIFLLCYLFRNNTSYTNKLAIVAMVFFSLFILFKPLIEIYGLKSVLEKLMPVHKITLFFWIPKAINTVPAALNGLLDEIVKSQAGFRMPVTIIMIFTLIISTFFTTKKKLYHTIFILSLTWMLYLISLKKEQIYNHWYWPIAIMYILTLGDILAFIIKKGGVYKLAGLMIFSVAVFNLSLKFEYINWNSSSFYEHQIIAEDIKKNIADLASVHIYVYSQKNNIWESGKLWYYLLDYRPNLFRLTDEYYNIIPVTSRPLALVVVCQPDEITQCQNFVKAYYPSSKYDRSQIIENKIVLYFRIRS